MTRRPASSEYNAYYEGYVSRAADDPIAQMDQQIAAFELARGVSEDEASTPPAPGEWTLKEVLVHLCDFERMFSYRALRFSRGDATPIEAFEQDAYVAASEANRRPLGEIVDELVSLRRATVLLSRSLSEEMLDRAGQAGGNPVTVRALVFITPGHSEGHLADLRRDHPAFR